MKKKLLLLLSILCFTRVSAQKDVIMCRDGSEMNVKIIQVGPKETIYKNDDKKKTPELRIDNENIFMIKYEKRDNVFFAESGERFIGDKADISSYGYCNLFESRRRNNRL